MAAVSDMKTQISHDATRHWHQQCCKDDVSSYSDERSADKTHASLCVHVLHAMCVRLKVKVKGSVLCLENTGTDLRMHDLLIGMQ